MFTRTSHTTAVAKTSHTTVMVFQKYFMSGSQYKVLADDAGASLLDVEWTNQHGCGGNEDTDPHKQNCNLVFQMMCHEDSDQITGE